MEELSTIFNNVGILVAALAGGISLVMFGFAGIQYMTAQGDPQGMSKAKMSVIGAVVGLAIAGLAFVMPGIISRLIVEPAGGQNVAGDSRRRQLRPVAEEPTGLPAGCLHQRSDARGDPSDSGYPEQLRVGIVESDGG